MLPVQIIPARLKYVLYWENVFFLVSVDQSSRTDEINSKTMLEEEARGLLKFII